MVGPRSQLDRDGLVLFDVNTLATYRGFFATESGVDTATHHLRWRGRATPKFAAGAVAEATLDIVAREGARLRTVHRQRHHLAPVRRLASIIKSTITDAVRSGPWSGASIVG